MSEPGVSWRDYVDARLASSDKAVQLTSAEAARLRDKVHALEMELARKEGSIATWRFLAGFFGLSGLIGLFVALGR